MNTTPMRAHESSSDLQHSCHGCSSAMIGTHEGGGTSRGLCFITQEVSKTEEVVVEVVFSADEVRLESVT